MSASFTTRLKRALGNGPVTLALTAAFALVLSAAAVWHFVVRPEAQAQTVTMYKNAGCQCCTRWAEGLKALGHKVEERPVSNLDAIKARFGIGEKFQGCHTALVDGYVIEGHVPFKEITRLLKERPDAKGLAVAGMPLGSPGMEVPGEKPDSYVVHLLKKDGTAEVYARY